MSRAMPIRVRGGRLAPLAALALLGGCAMHRAPLPLAPAWEALPPSSPLRSADLPRSDAWLRHYLVTGRTDSALWLLDRSRLQPRDRLLTELQRAMLLHLAGRYPESNAAFERAEREYDQRYTRSIRRAAGSLLVNDRVLAYLPDREEARLIPVYRMLNYAALGDSDAALVEARKATQGTSPSVGECQHQGWVRYLAGLTFLANGAASDAAVALRGAEVDWRACGTAPPPSFGADLVAAAQAAGLAVVADSARDRFALAAAPLGQTNGGELVLLIEQGWVAHRISRALELPIFSDQVDSTGRILPEQLPRLSELALTRFHHSKHVARPSYRQLGGRDMHRSVVHELRLTWPAIAEHGPAWEVQVLVNDSAQRAAPLADLSALAERALGRDLPLVAARTVARGVGRYVLARKAEEKITDRGSSTAGGIAAFVVNRVGNTVEQPDLRCWSALPDRLTLLRLSLPAGEHHLRVQILDDRGQAAGSLDLGKVRVQRGEWVIRGARIW